MPATITRLIGTLVENRKLLWGLGVGAFILTLALSSRHAGLWRSPPTGVAAVRPLRSQTTLSAASPPATAAVRPSFAIAAPEAVQRLSRSEPYSTPDADNEVVGERRDRGIEHGSRLH